MLFKYCFAIVFLIFVTSSSSKSLSPPRQSFDEGEPSEDLEVNSFEGGALLYCRKDWQEGMSHALYTHVVLATNSTHVAHLVGYSDTNQGELIEEEFTSYLERDNLDRSNCSTETHDFVPDVIKRARQAIEYYQGKTVYYDPKGCKSEHWVRNWGQTEPVSYYGPKINGNGDASPKCKAGKAYGDQKEVIVNHNADGT